MHRHWQQEDGFTLDSRGHGSQRQSVSWAAAVIGFRSGVSERLSSMTMRASWETVAVTIHLFSAGGQVYTAAGQTATWSLKWCWSWPWRLTSCHHSAAFPKEWHFEHFLHTSGFKEFWLLLNQKKKSDLLLTSFVVLLISPWVLISFRTRQIQTPFNLLILPPQFSNFEL